MADINKQEEKVVNILKDSGALYTLNTPDKKESDAIWNARRSSYSASTRLAPDVVSDDIVVPRDKLAQMIKKCKDIANKYSLKVCIIGHAGDGNIHPQFVLNLDDEIEFKMAKKEGKIDEETYNNGYKVAMDLMQELREQKNDIVNRCQFDLCRIKRLIGLQ